MKQKTKSKLRPRRVRVHRRVHYERSPLREVLRLAERNISTAAEEAKTIEAFRKGLASIAADSKFWVNLNKLLDGIIELKANLDDLM
jgi:hypothetical protein